MHYLLYSRECLYLINKLIHISQYNRAVIAVIENNHYMICSFLSKKTIISIIYLFLLLFCCNILAGNINFL